LQQELCQKNGGRKIKRKAFYSALQPFLITFADLQPARPFKELQIGKLRKDRLNVHGMSAKEILLDVAQKLPPDATLSDAIYELEFRQAVQQGLAELDSGQGVPIEEVKAKIAEWAGK
jgi:hypothetical protein